MRGQTTLDFAIGVSLFLIVVVYVLAFIPGMFAPFDRAQEAETVAVDRVASNLVEGQLADPSEPYRLHRDCTIAFFNDSAENTDGDGTYSRGSDCGFRDVDLKPRIAIDDVRRVNVSIRGDVNDVDGGEDDDIEVLCFDANDDRIVDGGDAASGNQCDPFGGDGDVLLQAGEPIPEGSESVATARRVVHFRNETVAVEVRMW
jgi:hypothetical protein